MNNYTNDSIFTFLGFMVFLCAVGAVLYWSTEKTRSQTRYIKLEINRNIGVRRRYWKEELKRHRVRSIPLIGRWLERKIWTK